MSRKERDKKTRRTSGEDKSQTFSSENPFLPRRMSDLSLGFLVKVISAAGSRISQGVVRYIGYIDGEEKIGIEFKEKIGNCDGSLGGRKYFSW